MKMKAEQIEKDLKELRKLYGNTLEIEVCDGYYCCRFTGKLGKFYFLETYEAVGEPHGLCYEDRSDNRYEKTFKAIKELMEV